MSERIDQIIQEISLKFQIAKEEIALLKNEKNNLLNKIEILRNDNEVLLSAVSSKEDSIKSLLSEIEDLKFNLNQPNQQSLSQDYLIDELVKEIDDCISLLKK
jgi:hypothetical protein